MESMFERGRKVKGDNNLVGEKTRRFVGEGEQAL